MFDFPNSMLVFFVVIVLFCAILFCISQFLKYQQFKAYGVVRKPKKEKKPKKIQLYWRDLSYREKVGLISVGIAGIFAGFVSMGVILFLSYYGIVYYGENNPFVLVIETIWWVYSFVVLLFLLNKIIHDLVNEEI